MELRMESLQKSYEGRLVLSLPELTLASRGITAIIGPNGAGKSTLLRLIAGLEKPDHGRILYDGAAALPRERVTMGFQKPYLLNTTVEKNIAYPLQLRGWDRIEAETRVDALLAELSLEEHRKKKPWKLSGGEIQKVALARALSFSPDLLLLDEPTANIDPVSVMDIEAMLRKVNEQGMTILLISHNLAQARRLSDRILFLDRGRLVEDGETAAFFANPREDASRWFIAQELVPGPNHPAPLTKETP